VSAAPRRGSDARSRHQEVAGDLGPEQEAELRAVGERLLVAVVVAVQRVGDGAGDVVANRAAVVEAAFGALQQGEHRRAQGRVAAEPVHRALQALAIEVAGIVAHASVFRGWGVVGGQAGGQRLNRAARSRSRTC
jgi:hypothetical protein